MTKWMNALSKQLKYPQCTERGPQTCVREQCMIPGNQQELFFFFWGGGGRPVLDFLRSVLLMFQLKEALGSATFCFKGSFEIL